MSNAYQVFNNTRMRAKRLNMPFRLTLNDFRAVWGDRFDQREALGLHLQRIDLAAGWVVGNLTVSAR